MLLRDDIRRHVCAVIAAIQTDSGLASPTLTDDVKPLDLPGFDSLAMVDAEVRLSQVCGIELDHVPFKSTVTGQDQTIAEIVAQLAEKYATATPDPSMEKRGE